VTSERIFWSRRKDTAVNVVMWLATLIGVELCLAVAIGKLLAGAAHLAESGAGLYGDAGLYAGTGLHADLDQLPAGDRYAGQFATGHPRV